MKIHRLLLLLPFIFGLFACGQKGPLYLPKPTKPITQAHQNNTAE